MKKKLLLLAVVLLIAALTACMLAACNGDDGTPGADDPSAETPGTGDAGDTPGTGDTGDTPGTGDTGDTPGTDDPQEGQYINADVLNAYMSRTAGYFVRALEEVTDVLRVYAYAVDPNAADYLAEEYGYGSESAGIIAWGVVGEIEGNVVSGTPVNEYTWSDGTVFWMAYESADMAEEKGLSGFGIGATAERVFPPASYFEGFAFTVVGNCVVTARTQDVVTAFLNAETDTAYDDLFADMEALFQQTEGSYAVASLELDYGYDMYDNPVPYCSILIERDDNYSNVLTNLVIQKVSSSQEAEEYAAMYEEVFASSTEYGKGSYAYAIDDLLVTYLAPPEPGFVFELSEDGLYATAKTYYYNSPTPEVEVPAEWNGVPVTNLDMTFMNAKGVQHVILPDTLTRIGGDAFYASGVKSITIPASVTEIMYSAFMGCDALAEIHIEEGSGLDIDDFNHASFGNVFSETAWYEAQPDGPLYIDGILVGYKNYVPGEEDAYIDRTVLDAFTARINETLTSEASERSEQWRAYAYSVDIAAAPEFLENVGYGTESEGIVAWGVVGEKSGEDTGTGGHAEYAWSDDTVFWVAYESADMAEERGLDGFGIGATNATMFPSAAYFEGFAFTVVGNCVVAARMQDVVTDFLNDTSEPFTEVLSDAVSLLQAAEDNNMIVIVDGDCAMDKSLNEVTPGFEAYTESDSNYANTFEGYEFVYFPDEVTAAETAAIADEGLSDTESYGEESYAAAYGKWLVQYVKSPAPGLHYELSEDGTYAGVISYVYDSPADTVEIPSEWNGVPVTKIYTAFTDAAVKEVILPDTLASIGYGAFEQSGIERITIPASVTSIDMFAFAAPNLAEIHIEEGSPLTVDDIDVSAFVGSAWYEAQPDGPLCIDGILVGYKNYVPTPDPEPEPAVDTVPDEVANNMKNFFLAAYSANGTATKGMSVVIELARQSEAFDIMQTRGFAVGAVAGTEGGVMQPVYAWIAYPTQSEAETYGAQEATELFGTLCDGLTGEVVGNCYVLSSASAVEQTADDGFSQFVVDSIMLLCGPAETENTSLMPVIELNIVFESGRCLVSAESRDDVSGYMLAEVYASEEERDAALAKWEADLLSGNVEEKYAGGTAAKAELDGIEGVYCLQVVAAV